MSNLHFMKKTLQERSNMKVSNVGREIKVEYPKLKKECELIKVSIQELQVKLEGMDKENRNIKGSNMDLKMNVELLKV